MNRIRASLILLFRRTFRCGCSVLRSAQILAVFIHLQTKTSYTGFVTSRARGSRTDTVGEFSGVQGHSPAPFPVLRSYPNPRVPRLSAPRLRPRDAPEPTTRSRHATPHVPSLPRRPTTSSPCLQVVTSNPASQCQRVAAPCLLRMGPRLLHSWGFELGSSKLPWNFAPSLPGRMTNRST